MTGLTTNLFQPGDFCYVVVYTPQTFYPRRISFLEGTVLAMDQEPAERPCDHPVWNFYQKTPAIVHSITAEAKIDCRTPQSIADLIADRIPQCDYLAISPFEFRNYFQKIITRQAKINHVQLVRIKALQDALNHCQSDSRGYKNI